MLKIVNPATEAVITEINVDTKASVNTKYQTARAAQKNWAQRPLNDRKKIVSAFRQVLQKNKQDCAQTLSQEMGKPVHQALGEIEATDARIAFFLDHVDDTLKDDVVVESKPWLEKISYDPLGVVANISAWNFPYFVGSNVFIPALLCGNTVLYKASEFTSLTGLKIEEMWKEAGVPDGVFQTLTGKGDVGQALLEQSVDGVFFTGSVATGQRILNAVAPRFIRTGFELGGKDPAYVCEDVDVDAAAAGLVDGAFYNAGQSCCAVERIYVHESVYDGFVESFARHTKALVVGDPLNKSTYMGPLARHEQVDVLKRQVDDALSKGAQLVVEGGTTEEKGWFFKPVVLAGVDHTMEIMREESFGPVIGIQKVSGDEEAIRLMNDTSFGLTSSVHTPDQNRARTILSQMDTGTVYGNACDRVSPYLPWTGRKDSGMGSTLSRIGILSFVQPKAWHLKSI